jgi:hypothetical protein
MTTLWHMDRPFFFSVFHFPRGMAKISLTRSVAGKLALLTTAAAVCAYARVLRKLAIF